LEVVTLLWKNWPDALKEKNRLGNTPLYYACQYGTFDVVSFLLTRWPEAAKEKNNDGDTPLLAACCGGASLEVVTLLWNSWPDALKEKYRHENTPLHHACRYGTFDVVSFLLKRWPEAAKVENYEGDTPLDAACCGGGVLRPPSFEVVLLLLDSLLVGLGSQENTNKSDVESLRRCLDCYEENDGIKKLLFYVFALFRNDNETFNNPTPKEILTFFNNIKWWNGVALLIGRHPTVAKTMNLHTNTMAHFLSRIGCIGKLTAIWEILSGEQDLLAGV